MFPLYYSDSDYVTESNLQPHISVLPVVEGLSTHLPNVSRCNVCRGIPLDRDPHS